MKINVYFITLITLLIISFLNFGAIWIGVFGGNAPVNPIIFILSFFILSFHLKKRNLNDYFFFSNILFIVFFLSGFWSNHNFLDYTVIQSIFKFWIVIIGLPFLFLKSFNPSHLNFFLQTIIILAVLNSLIIIHQLVDLSFWASILAGGEEHAQRPAGLWVNPNNAGLLLLSAYVFTYYKDIDKSTQLLIYRLLIVLGIILVMSRTIIIVLLLIEIYRNLIYKDFKSLIYSTLGILFIVGILLMVVDDFDSFNRFSGDHPTASNFENSRGQFFTLALLAIGDDWFFGLGHTTMNHIVPIGSGLGPHNFYVWLLGTAGIFPLLAYLSWILRFLFLGLKSNDKNIKFIFISFFIIISLVSLTSHDFMLIQPVGVITSLLVGIEWMEKFQIKKQLEKLCVE